MSGTITATYQNYRAPSENYSSLVTPCALDIVAESKTFAGDTFDDSPSLEFCGKSLEDTRRLARQEAAELAVQYTSQYQSVSRLYADYLEQPFFLSGHQPELFHSGVWFKNFLLSQLAMSTGGVAINFLVDNDLCRDTAIRVPTRHSNAQLEFASLRFDERSVSIPWELRSLQNPEQWHSFPSRVQTDLSTVGIDSPLLHKLWPHTLESLKQFGLPGRAIAQARHKIESEIGLNTLEVPLSQLVGTRAFARFSIQLMSNLPRLQKVYNSQLDAYRKAHKIRSVAHPVPALEQQDGWLEGPWWFYRAESPTRQRLWIRMFDNQLILSDRAGWEAVIDGRLDCDNAATQWLELLAGSVCLRPRALLTTMYLRLFVADWFLHGIGGGKYDQLTDGILSEYFGIAPPPFAVATSTLHLPMIDSGRPCIEIEREIRAQCNARRQDRFHAERHVGRLGDEAKRLMDEKQRLLANIPPKGEKWEWHHELKRVNDQLAAFAAPLQAEHESALESLQLELKQAQIAESREFSFCLFPEDSIVPALKALALPS